MRYKHPCPLNRIHPQPMHPLIPHKAVFMQQIHPESVRSKSPDSGCHSAFRNYYIFKYHKKPYRSGQTQNMIISSGHTRIILKRRNPARQYIGYRRQHENPKAHAHIEKHRVSSPLQYRQTIQLQIRSEKKQAQKPSIIIPIMVRSQQSRHY